MESETHFCREPVKVWSGKVLQENFVADKIWSSAKLSVLKNDTVVANRDLSLTVEYLRYF